MELTRAPMTLKGKQLRTPPKSAPSRAYKTKSYTSNVDETLFGTPSRYMQQTETKRMSDEKEWDPPWVTRPTKRGVPLLWTPFQYKDFNGVLSTEADSKSSVQSRTPRSARAKNKYRLKSHTPTFVDETLFGSRLEEPAFDAPWNNSNTESNLLGKHFFSPEAKQSSPITPRTLVTALDRPGSRLCQLCFNNSRCCKGEYDDPYIPPTPRGSTSNTERFNYRTTPVIRERPGSSLQTPKKNYKAKNFPKQQLNFSDEDPETKDIIDRALRLAQATRDAALGEARMPHAYDSPWKRPASGPRSSPRSPRVRSARISDFVSRQDDDVLSATGRKIPLSARSDRSSRPQSAR